MEIIINHKVLLDALSSVAPFAGRDKALLVLNNVLFVTKGNDIRLQAGDRDRSIRRYITAESIDADGTFLVDCKKLLTLIQKTSTTDNIIMSTTDTQLTVKYRNGKATLPILPGSDYPDLFTATAGPKVRIPAATFTKNINVAKNFVGEDEYRPMMKQIHVSIKGNQLAMAATDTHILYTAAQELSEGVDEMSFFIDPTIVSSLISAAKRDDTIELTVTESTIVYHIGDTIILTTASHLRFPDVERVIPKNNTKSIKFSRKGMIDALARIGIFCNNNAMAIFTVANDNLTISAENIETLSSCSESLNVESQVQESFALNRDKFSTLLLSSESTDVTLWLKDSSCAMLMSDDDESRKYLIMPMSK